MPSWYNDTCVQLQVDARALVSIADDRRKEYEPPNNEWGQIDSTIIWLYFAEVSFPIFHFMDYKTTNIGEMTYYDFPRF